MDTQYCIPEVDAFFPAMSSGKYPHDSATGLGDSIFAPQTPIAGSGQRPGHPGLVGNKHRQIQCSPKFRLLQLPLEILQLVIEDVALQVGLEFTLRLRLVNKTFDRECLRAVATQRLLMFRPPYLLKQTVCFDVYEPYESHVLFMVRYLCARLHPEPYPEANISALLNWILDQQGPANGPNREQRMEKLVRHFLVRWPRDPDRSRDPSLHDPRSQYHKDWSDPFNLSPYLWPNDWRCCPPPRIVIPAQRLPSVNGQTVDPSNSLPHVPAPLPPRMHLPPLFNPVSLAPLMRPGLLPPFPRPIPIIIPSPHPVPRHLAWIREVDEHQARYPRGRCTRVNRDVHLRIGRILLGDSIQTMKDMRSTELKLDDVETVSEFFGTVLEACIVVKNHELVRQMVDFLAAGKGTEATTGDDSRGISAGTAAVLNDLKYRVMETIVRTGDIQMADLVISKGLECKGERWESSLVESISLSPALFHHLRPMSELPLAQMSLLMHDGLREASFTGNMSILSLFLDEIEAKTQKSAAGATPAQRTRSIGRIQFRWPSLLNCCRRPLSTASRKGHVEAVRRLLQAGARATRIPTGRPSCRARGVAITYEPLPVVYYPLYASREEHYRSYHMHCLVAAAEGGCIEAAGVMIQSTKREEAKKLAYRMFESACRRGHVRFLRWLVESGLYDLQARWTLAVPVVSTRPHVGYSAPMVFSVKHVHSCMSDACKYGHLEVVKQLVGWGWKADVDLAAPEYAMLPFSREPVRRPIVDAFRFERMDVCNYLLGLGARPCSHDEVFTDWDKQRVYQVLWGWGGSFWERRPYAPRLNMIEMYTR